jgi:hypothetical protein
MLGYHEKTRRLSHLQTLAPNLLGDIEQNNRMSGEPQSCLQNLKTCHTSLREELTKQLLLRDGEKNKLVSLPNYLARLRLDAKEVTPELLRLKFYCF